VNATGAVDLALPLEKIAAALLALENLAFPEIRLTAPTREVR